MNGLLQIFMLLTKKHEIQYLSLRGSKRIDVEFELKKIISCLIRKRGSTQPTDVREEFLYPIFLFIKLHVYELKKHDSKICLVKLPITKWWS